MGFLSPKWIHCEKHNLDYPLGNKCPLCEKEELEKQNKELLSQTIDFLKGSINVTLSIQKQLAENKELQTLFNDSEIPLIMSYLSDSAQKIQDVLDAITRRKKAKAKGIDLRT